MTTMMNDFVGCARFRLTLLESALTEKGYARPEARITLRTEDSVWDSVVAISYSADADNWESEVSKSFTFSANSLRPDLDAAVDAAMEHIVALKRPEEMKREQLITEFGRMIDKLREAGFDPEFMNPLEAMMKKLSENAIEHKVAAE